MFRLSLTLTLTLTPFALPIRLCPLRLARYALPVMYCLFRLARKVSLSSYLAIVSAVSGRFYLAWPHLTTDWPNYTTVGSGNKWGGEIYYYHVMEVVVLEEKVSHDGSSWLINLISPFG